MTLVYARSMHRATSRDDVGYEKMNKILPPTYFLGDIMLAVGLHFLLPWKKLIFPPWNLIALAPLAGGIVLNVLADRSFKRHETTVKPFERSRALVTDGAFRFTRNPMYLGMVLILAGVVGLLGSVTPWITVIGLVLFFDWVFIKPEEEMLEETFGDEFRKYRAHVRRWI